MNAVISDDYQLEEKFEEFVQQKKKMYSSYLEPLKSKYVLALINHGFIPSLWNKRKRHYKKFNHMRLSPRNSKQIIK